MSITLAKPYISWTQMEVWSKNKERYIQEYFIQGTKLDTEALRFGKKIAELIESGEHKEILPDLVVYSQPEYKMVHEIESIPVLSYVDSYDPENNVFREYKTGKNPWTQSKVQKHGQLAFYATVLADMTGTMPEYCHLDWIETKDSESTVLGEIGDINWKIKKTGLYTTGKITSFKRNFDIREIEAMRERIIRTANEISEAYQKFINENI